MPVTRRRLDSELVRRGLVSSRQGARSLIESGDVLVSGATADKPARMVTAGEPIVVQGPPPAFVGRAGGKLDAALNAFGIDVAGIRAIDVGASTGGFTDCLLQRGAIGVVALDVGHGQLHERLRGDDRVTVVERCNVRSLDPAACAPDKRHAIVGDQVPLVVADLSFISLRTVRDALVGLLVPGGEMVLLIKPQFEAGRQQVSRGSGVITDPAIWTGVLGDVISHFAVAGLALIGLIESPVRGTRGNVEFLAHLRDQCPTAHGDVSDTAASDVGPLIDAVVARVAHGDVAQGDCVSEAPSQDAPDSAPVVGARTCQ
jgi:23S rRNA (cytidine1920-2'-O)/16S rRNA (cytidine1409-2'-O)-methyltransferase